MTNLLPAQLDPSTWYHITEARVDNLTKPYFQSMLQVTPKGLAVWGNVQPAHLWQFYPLSESSRPGLYALRSNRTGANKQLSACYNADEKSHDKTGVCMQSAHADGDNDAQLWQVDEWGDKSYRLTNVGNSTDYALSVHKGNPPYMSNDFDGPDAVAMHWYMTSAAKVEDVAYSTAFSGVTMSTASTTEIPSTSGSSPADTPSNHSGGLSSGAAAGIGVGAALAVIALGIGAFFLWRRRRSQRSDAAAAQNYGGYEAPPPEKFDTNTAYGSYSYVPPQEVHSDVPVHELDSTMNRQ